MPQYACMGFLASSVEIGFPTLTRTGKQLMNMIGSDVTKGEVAPFDLSVAKIII